MRKKRKKHRIIKTMLKTVNISSPLSKMEILLIKNFMRLFSQTTKVKFKNLEIEKMDNKISMILVYEEPNPKIANLQDILILLLSGPAVKNNINIKLDSVVINVQDAEGNEKAKIEALVQNGAKFEKKGKLLEFISNWNITKLDKNFIIEEDVINQFGGEKLESFLARIRKNTPNKK